MIWSGVAIYVLFGIALAVDGDREQMQKSPPYGTDYPLWMARMVFCLVMVIVGPILKVIFLIRGSKFQP